MAWMALDPLVLIPLGIAHRHAPRPSWFIGLGVVWFVVLLVLTMALLRFLRRGRRGIRGALVFLNREDRAEAIRPLAAGASRLSPMRDLLLPFIRQTANVAELAPADAPTGRGDEPSASQ